MTTPGTNTYRGNLDPDVITLQEPWQSKYWVAQLGCTEQALRDAVAIVGPSASKVRIYLGQHKTDVGDR